MSNIMYCLHFTVCTFTKDYTQEEWWMIHIQIMVWLG